MTGLRHILFVCVVVAGCTAPRAAAFWALDGPATLVASGSAKYNYQGKAVSLSGDGQWMAVGAPYEGLYGATFVFERTNTAWRQRAKLVGSPRTSEQARQGTAVSLDYKGLTLAIGSPDDDPTGSVFVFARDPDSGAWAQQGGLLIGTGKGTRPQQGFVVDLAGSGNVLAVGAPNDDDTPGGTMGSVYIFTRSAGGVWTQTDKLTGAKKGLTFGYSVAMDAGGSTLIVGAPNLVSAPSGEARIFVIGAGKQWELSAVLVGTGRTPGNVYGMQGFAVAMASDGATAASCDPGDEQRDPGLGGVGACYVFARSAAGQWAQDGDSLVPPGDRSDTTGGNVGGAVQLSGDGTVLAMSGRPSTPDNLGGAHVFLRRKGGWEADGGKVVNNDPKVRAQGYALALSADGTVLAMGAPQNAIGATLVFVSVLD